MLTTRSSITKLAKNTARLFQTHDLSRSTHTLYHPNTLSQNSLSIYQWVENEIKKDNTKLLVEGINFDIGGTIVNYFCSAPNIAIYESFLEIGITLTTEQITNDMGNPKNKHVGLILKNKAVEEKWIQIYGHPPTDQDRDRIYDIFKSKFKKIIHDHTDIIPGVIEALTFLRKLGIKIGLTSGYTYDQAYDAGRELLKQFEPDAITTSDKVENGSRFAMIEKNNKKWGIRPERTIFISDAKSDFQNIIDNANKNKEFIQYYTRNTPLSSPYNILMSPLFRTPTPKPHFLRAYWLVGAPQFSAHLGFLNLPELKNCPPEELTRKRENVETMLRNSGAQVMMHSFYELPLIVLTIHKQLKMQKQPGMIDQLTIEYPAKNLEESYHQQERYRP